MPKLHAKDQTYSAGDYHVASLLSHRAIDNWLVEAKQSVRLHDWAIGLDGLAIVPKKLI